MQQNAVEYVIFDLDGLMIDSERVYTEVTNDILAKYGKTMTWDIKAGLMGKRLYLCSPHTNPCTSTATNRIAEREAAQHLLSFFPDIPLTIEDYLRQRDEAQDLRWPHVQPLPGVVKLVQHLHTHNIPMAIATGTRRRNLELKTGHLHTSFMNRFEGRIVCADDERLGIGRGKPCPDVFLIAAGLVLGRDIGGISTDADSVSQPEKSERLKGLVFEDAIPGVQAGKRAGMNVVWVPDSNLLGVEYSGTHSPDEILRSIEDFVPEKWGLPPYN